MAKATNQPKGFYFNMDPELKRKSKYIAAVDDGITPDITSVITKALGEYIDKWEKKNGPIPKKK